jgi:two-component system cell cycle response regulator CpdR
MASTPFKTAGTEPPGKGRPKSELGLPTPPGTAWGERCWPTEQENLKSLKGLRRRQAEAEMPHTILLVDDDTVLLATSAMMLEDCGCEVMTAQSGPAALEAIERNPKISHLVTDVQMPRMDGYELARQAIALRPSLSVFIMSGAARPQQGFVFLPKPFSLRQLQSLFGLTCDGPTRNSPH